MSALERGFGVAGGLTRFGGGNGVRVGLGVTIFQPPASGRSSRLGFQRERNDTIGPAPGRGGPVGGGVRLETVTVECAPVWGE